MFSKSIIFYFLHKYLEIHDVEPKNLRKAILDFKTKFRNKIITLLENRHYNFDLSSTFN